MRFVATLCLLLSFHVAAVATPANTLQELYAELRQCLDPLPLHDGTAFSVRFSLKRDGSLLGRPRVTYLRTPKDETDRDSDLKMIAEAFDRCLPAEITDALGRAIAGRLFGFSYLPPKREQKV